MIGLVGYALSGSHFVPNELEQTELVKNTMALLKGGFPLVCYSIGVIAFSRFRLTEREHVRIRTELDVRDQARS
jgi:Na+/melibiose symporter-like transporter